MKPKKNSLPVQRPKPRPPEPADRWLQGLQLLERCSWTELAKNSYVISRFWAWFSKIELEPHVRIPVPRFLSHRDP
jgi:hypothetical protein